MHSQSLLISKALDIEWTLHCAYSSQRPGHVKKKQKQNNKNSNNQNRMFVDSLMQLSLVSSKGWTNTFPLLFCLHNTPHVGRYSSPWVMFVWKTSPTVFLREQLLAELLPFLSEVTTRHPVPPMANSLNYPKDPTNFWVHHHIPFVQVQWYCLDQADKQRDTETNLKGTLHGNSPHT